MEITVYFFFNLSLLIVLLFFGVLWAERTKNLRAIQILAVFYFVVTLLICYVFTYRIGEYSLDLRKIPFILGSLYMGLGPILGVITIILRGFLGFDSGFWATFLYYGGTAILFWRLHNKFVNWSSNQRILFSVAITFFFSFVQSFTMGFMDMPTSISIQAYIVYLVIQPLGVGMIAYFIEEITKAINFQQHVTKSLRLEAVEQMGAAISHEVRNPLTAAMGFVQLLQDDTISESDRSLYLSIIRNELRSAENVILDYLTFSNPKMEYIRPFNIHDELKRVVQLLEPSAKKSFVNIETNLSTEGVIEGDKQKFHQVFVNVMKNSIEAMPNGGVLTIETEFSPTNVVIRVKDTGAGMTQEQIERLGEPYYSTKGNNGTGLGLMVVYSIVRAMNGTIHVESEVGAGTTFEFIFSSPINSVGWDEIQGISKGLVVN